MVNDMDGGLKLDWIVPCFACRNDWFSKVVSNIGFFVCVKVMQCLLGLNEFLASCFKSKIGFVHMAWMQGKEINYCYTYASGQV